MLPLLYSISEKAGKGRKEPMKMIGVGGGYRMEKEFDVVLNMADGAIGYLEDDG